ncbi:hypothetical protein ACTL31_01885 [Leuconostoc mesenteroides]
MNASYDTAMSDLNDIAIKVGDSQVRAFFAPEVPKEFNLHQWLSEQIKKRGQV